MKLTDAQWRVLEPYFPKPKRKNPEGGRPGYSSRELLQGVLWVMRTGARWNDLQMPKGYPSGSTCYRHFRKWVESGIFDKVIRALVRDLHKRGKIDLTETFIDATFVEAKKGELKSVKPSPAKGRRSWQSLTVDLFLSPCFLKVLHHMRVHSLSQLCGAAILGTFLTELSETKLTILIHLGEISSNDIDANSLLPISQIVKSHQLRMAELYDATDEDGWLNDSSLGFSPFDE